MRVGPLRGWVLGLACAAAAGRAYADGASQGKPVAAPTAQGRQDATAQGRADATAQGKPDGRPQITLHLYEEDAPNAPIAEVLAGLSAGLAARPEVRFVDLPDLLE